MKDPRSYADAQFARRLAYFREHRRTTLPHQAETATCLRVNATVRKKRARLRLSPDDGGLPFDLFDRGFRFDRASERLVFVGTGGEAVIDSARCVVGAALALVVQQQSLSCGECGYCRVGTRRMSEILDRIRAGRAEPAEVGRLEELAEQIHAASLCQVGRAAAMPVLATVRHFRDAYLKHVQRPGAGCQPGICGPEVGSGTRGSGTRGSGT